MMNEEQRYGSHLGYMMNKNKRNGSHLVYMMNNINVWVTPGLYDE